MNINIYKGTEVTSALIDKKFNLIKNNYSKDISLPNMNQIYLCYQYLPHSFYSCIYKLEQIFFYNQLGILDIIDVIKNQNIKDQIYIEGEDWLLELSIKLNEEKELYFIYINNMVRDMSVDRKRGYQQIFEIKAILEKLFLITSLEQEKVKYLPFVSASMYYDTSYKLYCSYLKHKKFVELIKVHEKDSIFHEITFTLSYDYIDELFNKNTDEEITKYTKKILNKGYKKSI